MKILSDREKDLSNQVVSFLRSHPFISVRQLEQKVGVSAAAISRAVTNDETFISPRHVFSIIRELSSYGIEIDGYRVEADNESSVIFLKKDIAEAEMVEVTEGTRTHFIYKQPQYRSVAGDLLDLL